MSQFYISVVKRSDPVTLDDARKLFEAYAGWLGDILDTTTVSAESHTLPAPYEAPGGVLLLARDDVGGPAGIVGIRAVTDTACEIKRLFVRADSRRRGLGRALARAALDHARALGYTQCYLTTVPGAMEGALRVYRSLGFEDTGPFRDFGHVPKSQRLIFLVRSL